MVAALATPSLVLAQAPAAWLDEWPRTDFAQSLVEFSEILSGGPPKDGIPSIDDPLFLPVGQAALALVGTEPVLSVEIAGDARAYPLRVLIWHEIVNDTVAGVPVAVTYCPLCNSGVVFEREVNGEVTTFGTTGKLRNSDLVMYDRATESWWQQFEGRAIVGARAGDELRAVPARLESIAQFEAREPDGQVLVPRNPGFRNYGSNPYRGYDTAARPFLYRGAYDGPGRPLMRIVAIRGIEAAWSLDFVRENAPVRVGDLVIDWTAGQNSALDSADIERGRDVGTVSVTRLTNGVRTPAVYDVPFAFAFRAFHPDAVIHHVE